jgi:PTH1 family peptidyl-tRNA hydrolase
VELIVGLGNPGKEYEASRHNIGFLVVNRLARTHGIPLQERKYKSRWGRGEIEGHPVILAKPRTYMNLSGDAVKLLLAPFSLTSNELIVIHDDLDLPFGRIKIKEKGGNGGHKGIQSIMHAIGSGDFLRIKVGIGRPPGGMDAADYVLQPFDRAEKPLLGEAIALAQEALELLLKADLQAAMNRYNCKGT